jgi:glycosyltransferase involved in cell wall biosynthesis
MTLVSIVMPAYNAARFIGAALASVTAQTFVDFEVVVVDDGSHDETAQIVAEAAASDPRIRLLAGAHAGVAAARNLGVAAARGDLVTFLDADDLWRPDRLARHVDFLSRNRETDVITGEVLLFEAIGADLEPLAGSAHVQLRGVCLGATTFRAKVFDGTGPFDDQLLHAEDLDFLLRVHDGGFRIEAERDVALLYRRHQTNMSNDVQASRRFFVQALHRSLTRRRAASYRPPGTEFPFQGPLDHLALRPSEISRRMAGRPAGGDLEG